MKLYELKNGKLNVYLLEANKDKIYSFKKESMRQIPEENRILKAISNTKNIFQKVPLDTLFEQDEVIFDKKSDTGRRLYHLIEPSKVKDIQGLLETYYNRSKDYSKNCIRIKNNETDNIQYLILKNIKYTYGNPERKLDCILNVPKSLYNLELFFKERYDKLTKEEIYNILLLFYRKITIGQINMSELSRANTLGLIKGYNNLLAKIENDQKVLKLL